MRCKIMQDLLLKRSEGFTLIEVMIALVILAVGLLGVAALQLVAIKSNSFSSEMTYATMKAQEYAEILKSLPYTDPSLDPAGNPHTPLGGSPSSKGVQYAVTWNVTDNTPATDMKSVAITVQWQSLRQGKASEAGTVTSNLRTIVKNSS